MPKGGNSNKIEAFHGNTQGSCSMIRQMAYAVAALFWTGAAVAQAPTKPDADKGKEIASQVCAACHAADGNSPLAANPKVAGQFYEYLHKQLVNFKPQAGKKP